MTPGCHFPATSLPSPVARSNTRRPGSEFSALTVAFSRPSGVQALDLELLSGFLYLSRQPPSPRPEIPRSNRPLEASGGSVGGVQSNLLYHYSSLPVRMPTVSLALVSA